MSTALQVLTDVERQLATISTVDEAKDLRDQAEALRMYAKNARQGLAIQNHCSYVKILAERKAGALLNEVPRVRNRKRGGDGIRSAVERIGISPATAHQWMKIAKLPAVEFEALVKKCKDDRLELTSVLVYSEARLWCDGDTPSEPARPRVADTYFTAINRFQVAVRRAEETPERLRETMKLLLAKYGEIRDALSRLEQVVKGDES